MRKTTLAVVAAAFLASLPLAGCGSGKDTAVEFKPTDVSNLDQMKDSMTKHLKTKNYVDRTAK